MLGVSVTSVRKLVAHGLQLLGIKPNYCYYKKYPFLTGPWMSIVNIHSVKSTSRVILTLLFSGNYKLSFALNQNSIIIINNQIGLCGILEITVRTHELDRLLSSGKCPTL